VWNMKLCLRRRLPAAAENAVARSAVADHSGTAVGWPRTTVESSSIVVVAAAPWL